MKRISIYFGDAEVVITDTPQDHRYAVVYADTSIINNLGAKIQKKLKPTNLLLLSVKTLRRPLRN